ncbi:MAG: hypothetical protein KKC68_05635 [Candidatus Thermoplasmatota archaeon]|nr:hypothetical protein [Candidatus Thermoplasmatota archaeon]MBU1941237.1 hypothetical protein [Candidatus Thermoplasmatota archaeon]
MTKKYCKECGGEISQPASGNLCWKCYDKIHYGKSPKEKEIEEKLKVNIENLDKSEIDLLKLLITQNGEQLVLIRTMRKHLGIIYGIIVLWFILSILGLLLSLA